MRVNSGQQSIVEFLVLAHFHAHVVDKKGFVFFFLMEKIKVVSCSIAVWFYWTRLFELAFIFSAFIVS